VLARSSSAISPQQALAELARRELSRRHLIDFIQYTFPQYRPASHHHLIADRLEAVERGELDRLMITMPPRHGKSELASRRFPAWFLGRNPGNSIIAASYNSDLASDFGREVRNIITEPEYGAVFKTALAQDSKAANRWHTQVGGAYVAAGVGTAVTGRGADILLIDDPLKDREEADSEVRRQRVWEWYTSTAYTRLAPGGRIIVIQTRWHEDDLSGRLLTAMDEGKDHWELLSMPAISNKGEALWPQQYPLPALERIKANIGPRDWSALYQQSPAPDEGLYFKREWFRFYTELPKHLHFYGASDYAVTADGGDFTVHGVAGIDADANIYVADVWRQQTESNLWVDAFCDLILKWKPLYWAEEQGQILKSLGPFIAKRMLERKSYCAREQFVSVSDKPTRARSFQARTAMGKVYLPANAPWVAAFMAELLSFPAGVYDDQVDMVGLLGRLIDKMVGASIPQAEPDQLQSDYVGTNYREEVDADNWRTN
jgi:predicted phage terminase large subunit-like protein